MPFIHPLVFWIGLGSVSLPIIIHLLNRRRFKIRRWAAMQFLLDSIRKNRRRLRIEELILLAIRCLVVLLLGLGLARFTGCSALNALPIGDSSASTTVFIVDDSFSMDQKHGAGTVFTTATADLADELRKLPQTDRVAIILTSQPDAANAFFGPNLITDRESLISRLTVQKPSDLRSRLPEAMAAAGAIFRSPESVGTKRLFVYGDFRRVDLKEQAAAIKQQYSALRTAGVGVGIIDYGKTARTNLTVAAVEMLDKFAIAKVPFRVGVTVRNNGLTSIDRVEVKMSALMQVEGTAAREITMPVQTVESVEPGETRQIECTVTCPTFGSAVIKAELPGDELSPDNVGELALEVRDALKVLVIDGRMDVADASENESFFLCGAIDPTGDGSYGRKPEVVSIENIGGVNFGEYDLVMLMNVAEFPLAPMPAKPVEGTSAPVDAPSEVMGYPHLEALKSYVNNGGGLAIFLGDRVNLTFYNGPFFGTGSSLLPLRLAPPVGDALKKDKLFRIDARSIATDRMLRVFSGEAAVAVNLIRFFSFMPADDRSAVASGPAKPTRILARFNDPAASPAIVTRQYGAGNVIMFTSAGHTRWTDWPTDELGTYVSVMNDMVTFLARQRKENLTGKCGEPFTMDIERAMANVPISLKTPRYPGEDVVPLLADGSGAGKRIAYDSAVHAGVYTVSFAAPGKPVRDVLFVRNVDPAEGDLTPGGRSEIAAAAGADDFGYRQKFSTGPGGEVKLSQEKDYWMWLVLGALVLLAAETFLAQRFGHYTQ